MPTRYWAVREPRGLLLRSLGLLALQLAASVACAQSATDAGSTEPATAGEPEGTASLQEIKVSASRISNSPYVAPTPVAVVGELNIQQQAISTAQGALALLPEQNNETSPSNTSGNVQNQGASEANLRDLGGNRTLTLVNGERFMPITIGLSGASRAGAVDLSLIPVSLIQRMDVVTGGASASWGSDAVAGVVNVILNNNLSGLRAQAQYGVTQYGDNENEVYSIDFGTNFAEGRGHFQVSTEFYNNNGAGACSITASRSWCAPTNGLEIASNPTPGVNGYPATVLFPNGTNYQQYIPNSPLPTLVNGGIIPNGPLAGYAFDSHSVPYKYIAGTVQQPMGPSDAPIANIINPGSQPIEHHLLYARGSFDLTPNVRATLDVNYGYVGTSYYATEFQYFGGPPATNTMHICNNPGPTKSTDGFCAAGEVNPYLTPQTIALMNSANLVDIPVNLYGPQFGFPYVHNSRDLLRGVAGLNGNFDLFGHNWLWHAYDQYASSLASLKGNDLGVVSNINAASHAVTVSAANVGTSGLPIGSTACLSTLTHPTNGCVPVNYMGLITPTPAQLGYITGDMFSDSRTTQNVAAADISGSLFSLPAGPVALATGIEARVDHVRTVQNPLTAASAFLLVNMPAATGTVNVKEVFLETQVPLLKDLPAFNLLAAQLAGRITDYSTSGTVRTWKLGLTDDVTSNLRLRGTVSQDIRAPNLWELYSTRATTGTAGLNDPVTHQTNIVSTAVIGGNPTLKPEVAKTYTAGFVVRGEPGSWLGGLNWSIDYYHIDIADNIIAGPGAQQLINACAAGLTQACAYVVRDANNNLAEVINTFVNLNDQKAAGFDMHVDYSHHVGPGVVSASVVINRATQAEVVSGLTGSITNNLGVQAYNASSGGELKWNSIETLNYTTATNSVTLRVNWYGNGHLSATSCGPGQSCYNPFSGNSVSVNSIPGAAYFALSATHTLWTRDDLSLQLYGSIENLFNAQPPTTVVQQTFGGFFPYASYDELGRRFTIGLRAKL